MPSFQHLVSSSRFEYYEFQSQPRLGPLGTRELGLFSHVFYHRFGLGTLLAFDAYAERVALQRAPVKGRNRITKPPTLAGRNRLCGLRRPLQGPGSPVLEVDVYGDATPDLDSLAKCYTSFAAKGRPPGQFGAVAKRRRQAAPCRRSSTSAATGVSRLRAPTTIVKAWAPRSTGGGQDPAGQLGHECAESPLRQPAAVMPHSTSPRSDSRHRQPLGERPNQRVIPELSCELSRRAPR